MPLTIKIPGVTEALVRKNYYHGLIPREDLPEFLKKNGQFILRITEPKKGLPQSVVLSVMFDQSLPVANGMKHYVVACENGRFSFNRESYPSIEELVEQYCTRQIPLDSGGQVRIGKGVGRKKWELYHERITIGKKLGEGAYGEVCLGTLDGDKVAIKSCHMQNLNKEQIKEVMNEVRNMRRLTHPNIVMLRGIAAFDEPLYIVMELASDGSLDGYLKKNRTDNNTKTKICRELCWALQYLRLKAILHRDLAARNLLYHYGAVKLSDFGKSQKGPTYKMDPNEKLPIRWLSPETMVDLVFNYGTDVWSFGIVCWEVFANGDEPYPGLMVREVNLRVVSGDRPKMPMDTPNKIRELVETHIFVSAKDRLDIDQIAEHFTSITGVAPPPPLASERETRGSKKKKDRETGHSRGSSNSSQKSNEKTRM